MSSISLSTSQCLVSAVLASAIALGTLGGHPWAGTAHASDGQPDASTPTLVQSQEAEDSDPEANLPYLFAVFAIAWGGFFAYIFVMTGRRRQMQRELEALRAALAERESDSEQDEQPK